MEPINIKVILGSTRPNRFGDKPANWIYKEAQKLEGVNVEMLDLRDWPLPFFNQPMSPSQVKDGNYGDETVNAWSKKIKEADAYVIVSPEYNRGPSAVLKNALDSVYYEWNQKTVGFVSYGSVGGARAVEHLRLSAVELQMAPVRAAVHIPGNITFSGQWNEETEAQLKGAADTMLKQVVWWATALKTARG